MQVTSVSHPYNRMSFGAIALQKCMQKELSTVGKGFNKGVSEILQNFELPNKPVTKVNKGIFNFGIFSSPQTKREKAEVIINRYATSAAGTSAILAQEPGVGLETAALTFITKTMIKKIFNTYERGGAFLGAITGTMAGSYLGVNAAKKAIAIVPGAGNAANASITYGLHQVIGRACILYCENTPRSFDKTASNGDIISRIALFAKQSTHIIESETVRKILNKTIDIIF